MVLFHVINITSDFVTVTSMTTMKNSELLKVDDVGGH